MAGSRSQGMDAARMKPEIHMNKAAYCIATFGRLNTEQDYKLILSAIMQTCTNWMNAIFHAKRLASIGFGTNDNWYLDDCPDR